MSGPSLIGMCVVGVIGAMIESRIGLDRKWQVALGMTIVPFWYLCGVFRARWALASFWISVTAYFLVHLLLIWIVFSVALSGVHRVPYAISIPVTMVETVVLAMAVDGLERKIRKKYKSANH